MKSRRAFIKGSAAAQTAAAAGIGINLSGSSSKKAIAIKSADQSQWVDLELALTNSERVLEEFGRRPFRAKLSKPSLGLSAGFDEISDTHLEWSNPPTAPVQVTGIAYFVAGSQEQVWVGFEHLRRGFGYTVPEGGSLRIRLYSN